MNRLFGTKKKEEKKEEPKYEGPSLMETSTKLGERGDVLQKKVNDLNAELMGIKKEMLTAKGMKKK